MTINNPTTFTSLREIENINNFTFIERTLINESSIYNHLTTKLLNFKFILKTYCTQMTRIFADYFKILSAISALNLRYLREKEYDKVIRIIQ